MRTKWERDAPAIKRDDKNALLFLQRVAVYSNGNASILETQWLPFTNLYMALNKGIDSLLQEVIWC